MNLKEFLDTVREAAGPEVWSEGVMMARSAAVQVESEGKNEVRLRVTHPHTAVMAQVQLFLDDQDWTCSVQHDDDPNAFVCAAIIAYKKLKDLGTPIQTVTTACVSYALQEIDDYVHMQRVIAAGEHRHILKTTLANTISGKGEVPVFAASPQDQAIDRAIGFAINGSLNASLWQKIIPELVGNQNVSLDGNNILIDREPLSIEVLIKDEGPGIFIKGQMPASIKKVYKNGLAFTQEGKLHPFRNPQFPAPLHEWLARGHFISRQELANFMAEQLPIIKERSHVVIASDNLPDSIAAAELHIVLEAHCQNNMVSVTAKLVYGDPPLAEVSGEGFLPLSRIIPTRNKDQERKLRDEVWQKFGLTLGKAQFFPEQQALSLMQKWKSADIMTEGPAWTTYQLQGQLKPKLNISGDELYFDFTDTATGTQKVDASQVLQRFQSGDSLLFIHGVGGFALPTAWLEQHAAVLRELLQNKAGSEFQKMLLAPALAAAATAEDLSLPLAWQRRAEKLRDLLDTNSATPNLPQLNAVPRHYQTEGITWLAKLQHWHLGGILADDMGLGKTMQTLAIMRSRVLVVVPTTLLYNWEAELKKFRPDLSFQVYHGAQRKWPNTLPDVLITSYGLIRLELERFSAEKWQLIVADEAQAIKNADSLTAKALHQLDADCRIALTGTPIENRLSELWSIFRFALPELLGSKAAFDEWQSEQSSGGRSLLRTKIQPFILRRLKENVAKDLPEKSEAITWIDLSEAERSLYDSLQLTTRRDLMAKISGQASVLELLELILRLRQASCHTGLIPGAELGLSSKLDFLSEQLQDLQASGQHALVFSQWTSFLDLIEQKLALEKLSWLRIDGSTKNRHEIVSKFQTAETPQILLMSLKAGGVGLNLTAADHVFIMDPWWNPAVERQAADRAHRIGRERTVFVHKLIARGTIEEGIVQLQERKAELAEAVLEGHEIAAGLTREDLLDLVAQS